MKTCQVCSVDNPDRAPSCSSCGAPLGVASTVEAPGHGGGQPSHGLRQGVVLCQGEYIIEKELGSGGFAVAYLAKEESLGREVAIKEFFPDERSLRNGNTVQPNTRKLSQDEFQTLRDKFLSEARVLATFDHPGIVRVFRVFEENNTAYMVQEYLPGGSLFALVDQQGPLRDGPLLDYCEHLCDGLHAVHSKNFVHLDIKPENIMFNADQRPVLVDFGLSRQFIAGHTMRYTGYGSEGYAAPEQSKPRARFGPFTDVYSLGATVYFCLTGTVPPAAGQRGLGVELQRPHEIRSSIDRRVSEAIMWAMELEEVNRPQSAREFLSALTGRTVRNPSSQKARHSGSVSTPFKFKNGQANSLSELVELADRFWDEAEDYLFHGDFATWLPQIGEASLAQQARTLSATFKREQRKGLELFVREASKAAGLNSLPMLSAKPAQLDLGKLPVGARTTVPVRLLNQGRGYAWGTVALQPALRGVSAPSTFEGPAQIDLQLDLGSVTPGKYRSELVVQADGIPTNLSVPVTIEVVPISLRVEPSILDLGALAFGTASNANVRVNTSPAGGRVVGKAILDPSLPGVACESKIEGANPDVRVTIDTCSLEAGRDYATCLRLDTNAGRTEVPLRFTTSIDWGIIWQWTGGCALGGAVTLGACRAFLASTGPAFGNWFLAFSPNTEALWMGGLTAAVVGGSLFLFIRNRRRTKKA